MKKIRFDWLDGKSLALGMALGLFAAMLILYLIPSAYAASSQAPPCPIFISLQTIPSYANVGLHVVLKDGGVVIAQQVSIEGGEVLFELGGIADCKPYMATVLECDDISSCTKEVSFNPSGPIIWNLAEAVPITTTTIIPTTTTTTTTTLPPVTTTIPECAECPICVDCQADYTGYAIVITALFMTVGGAALLKQLYASIIPKGWGVRIYKGTDGSIKIVHKHPGIVSYHDPDIVHNNPEMRHPKGKIF